MANELEPIPRVALTVAEAAASSRIGRNVIYEAVGSGELRAVRIGRRVVIPVESFNEWIRQLLNRGPRAS